MIFSLSNIVKKLTQEPEKNILVIIKEIKLALGGRLCSYNKIDVKSSMLVGVTSEMNIDYKHIIDDAKGYICYETTMAGFDSPVIINDLSKTDYALSDPRVSKLNLKSYLGVPIRVDNIVIGSLAIVDTVVRDFTEEEVEAINNFASLLMLEEAHVISYKRLMEASEKADNANRQKTLSLASMSHELRTPLNSIIGFSDLLLDEDTTDEERGQFTKLIQTAGRSLMQLIADIIDISKIEVGEVIIQKTKFNVNTFLQEVFLMFKHEKENRGKSNIELKLILSDQINDLRIETDSHRLRQVFSNLLTNSLKFVDEGYIEFGYSSISPDNIQFFVKDTGVGIGADKKEVIFDQYGQSKDTYSRNREGTGLGLAISKSFVELLGGNIWVDSELDEGSTFYFTIPLSSDLSTQKSDLFYHYLEVQNVNWSNHTILVVDDVRQNFIYLNGLLHHTKAEILWVRNGKEAVDICRENNSIDMVLMDIRMPVMDGFEASQIIKKENPNIFIVAQTAFSSPEDRKRCMDSLCDGYLTKPIDYKELFSILTKLFG